MFTACREAYADQREDPTMAEERTVCVASFVRDREADLARMALESNGIECLLSADDCGGMRPYMSFNTGIRITVKESEATRAQKILENLSREEK